jgi:transcription initiation factor IIF auxiliary subunit
MAIWRHIIMTTEQEVATKPESELQPMPSITTDELSQVQQATQTLVDALKGLAQAKIQSATDLTEDAHQGIEKSVQILRDEADRSWQAAIHQVEDIDDRMTKAAKAAWEILTSPPSDPKA